MSRFLWSDWSKWCLLIQESTGAPFRRFLIREFSIWVVLRKSSEESEESTRRSFYINDLSISNSGVLSLRRRFLIKRLFFGLTSIFLRSTTRLSVSLLNQTPHAFCISIAHRQFTSSKDFSMEILWFVRSSSVEMLGWRFCRRVRQNFFYNRLLFFLLNCSLCLNTMAHYVTRAHALNIDL